MTNRLENMDTRCGECGVDEGELHVLGCQKEICPFCGKPLVNCICYFHFKTNNIKCPFCGNEIETCSCGHDVIFEELDRFNEPFKGKLDVDREKLKEFLKVADYIEKMGDGLTKEERLSMMEPFRNAIKIVPGSGMTVEKFNALAYRPLSRMESKKSSYIEFLDTIQYDDEEWIKKLESKERVPNVFTPNLCIRCGILDPIFFSLPDKEWNDVVPIHLRKKILCKDCYEHLRDLVGYENGVNVDDYILAAGNWERIKCRNGDNVEL